MKSRLDVAAVSPHAFETILNLGAYLADNKPDVSSRHTMDLRPSRVNGRAHCIEIQRDIARAHGESEQRLNALNVRRESPFYSKRERAALAWTEAVTRAADGHVPDEVYATARAQFAEKALVDLTLAVVAINGWNRLCVAFRSQSGGSYPRVARARKHAEASS